MSREQTLKEQVSRLKMQRERGDYVLERTYESGTKLKSHPPWLMLILTYLALGELRLDRRPSLALSSITQQVHDNCALRNRLIDIEKVCSRNPAILQSIFPGLPILPDTNNDIQAIVS